MKFSTVLAAAGLASIASAAPASDIETRATYGAFDVVNFNFGCTSDCGWLFNVTIPASFPNHRPVKEVTQCKGTQGAQKGFVACTPINGNQAISAYVGKTGSNGAAKLFLEYTNRYPAKGVTYNYFGNTTVFSQTGPKGSQQKSDFIVKETSASAVA